MLLKCPGKLNIKINLLTLRPCLPQCPWSHLLYRNHAMLRQMKCLYYLHTVLIHLRRTLYTGNINSFHPKYLKSSQLTWNLTRHLIAPSDVTCSLKSERKWCLPILHHWNHLQNCQILNNLAKWPKSFTLNFNNPLLELTINVSRYFRNYQIHWCDFKSSVYFRSFSMLSCSVQPNGKTMILIDSNAWSDWKSSHWHRGVALYPHQIRISLSNDAKVIRLDKPFGPVQMSACQFQNC